MTTNNAVARLHTDLTKMRHAHAGEVKAAAAAKKAAGAEQAALATIATQEQGIVDQFLQPGTLDPATQARLLNQMFALGQKSMQARDKFDGIIAKDKQLQSKDHKAYQADHKKALHDLRPAEFQMGLKDTNRVRKELGLNRLKHALRAPGGKGADAIKVAKSVLGHNISQLERSGSLAKYLDNTSSHVSCANFVSACLQKAGLISAGEHDDTVTGLASKLAHDKNWQKVSSNGLKPGDVVCFEVPGEGHMAHVEMYAGNGQFIGSNNVNADGSQRISMGSVGYHIDAVYRHR